MQNNKIKINLIVAAALMLLTSCGKAEVTEEVTTTEITTTTAAELNHILVRGWTMNELFQSITADGKNLTFPLSLEDFEDGGSLDDCDYSEGKITFSGGGTLEITGLESVENGSLVSLTARDFTAPRDFSIYGISLNMTITDVRNNLGIPDTVWGDPDNEEGDFIYYGASLQQLQIKFDNKNITEIILQG